MVRKSATSDAKRAHLHYVHENALTITRQRRGKTFVYRNARGTLIKNSAILNRIRKLALPPAYVDLKIAADPRAHLQAIGRDARGRKQYRYHPEWREVRDANKYHHILKFARKLPAIRRRCEHDLRMKGLPRAKVLAAVVELLEKTLIRIGNVEYARENDSFGLTTMRNKHVHIEGSTAHFTFLGKSKVHHTIDLHDRRLVHIIRNCQELPGHSLFEYQDENGHLQSVRSEDVNRYLHEIAGNEFTAKDFRTWAGTVLAAYALRDCLRGTTVTANKRTVNEAVDAVAKKLGNTKAICRKCYIHPEIFLAFNEGDLRGVRTESAVLALLARRLKRH